MSIYKGNSLIAGGRQCMPLLSFMWADHVLNDASWLRADTFSWQSGSVYQAAYQHLVDDLNAVSYASISYQAHGDTFLCTRDSTNDIVHEDVQYYAWDAADLSYPVYTTSVRPSLGSTIYDQNFTASQIVSSFVDDTQTETISGVTITYYQAADGHKLVLPDQESNVTAIYNATGVAWYYILDTVNQRFKLPRTKFGFTGIRSGVGNYVSPGIPNITGKFSPWGYQYQLEPSGVFYQTGTGTHAYSAGDAWVGSQINFDASRSSSVYGASDTVQSPATEMYLYFYVGNFTQTALENTAGITAETLNDKADLSLVRSLNMMPDYENAVQHTNNAPASYTTTEPCWICCKGSNLAYDMTIGNTTISEFLYSANYNSSWVFCPAGCTLTRIATSQYNNFIVVPLKG